MNIPKHRTITIDHLALAVAILVIVVVSYFSFADRAAPSQPTASSQPSAARPATQPTPPHPAARPDPALAPILKAAEARLDPTVVAAARRRAREEAEARREARVAAMAEPLTDVAPPQPEVEIGPEDDPGYRWRLMNGAPAPQARPSSAPELRDPFARPEIIVDIRRKRD
ncbi:MAG: hypothetical protein AB1634_19450 [Thermodesulfobacteriota bacterium]